MHVIDFIVVGGFMLFLLGLGFFLSRKAAQSSEEFILGGRNMPWWLAGLSMIATGLNASTMLQDSRKVRQDGIGGLWFTWTGMIHNAISAIFFLRLWRRAGFVTQQEFYHARYHGWRADFARVFESVFLGLGTGLVWSAVGLVGMKKIATVILDVPETWSLGSWVFSTETTVVIGLVIIALSYSAASGVYGVVWTDVIEFVVTFLASLYLMFAAYGQVGGSTGLRDKLVGLGEEGERILNLYPASGWVILFFFLCIFPFFTQGSYNPYVQRYLCLKDEREVIFANVFNSLINLVIKAWPFYIVGLCGIFLVSDHYLLENYAPIQVPGGGEAPDYERVYPSMVSMYLPAGMVGLMVAGFMGAFMSSFDTNIHNGTAIFLNDLYRPYVAKARTEKHYINVMRIFMVVMTVAATAIGIMANDILLMTMFALTLVSSMGMVKLLRFVWWRVNGWGEVAAQISGLTLSLFMISPWSDSVFKTLMDFLGVEGNDGFFLVRVSLFTFTSTTISILVILLTPPEPMERLKEFYQRVRPYGAWGPVREALGNEAGKADSIPLMAATTISIIALNIGALFLAMGLLLAQWMLLFVGFPLLGIGVLGLILGVRKLYPKPVSTS